MGQCKLPKPILCQQGRLFLCTSFIVPFLAALSSAARLDDIRGKGDAIVAALILLQKGVVAE